MATVLIVDDETSMREMLRILLERKGHTVHCAAGIEGVETALAEQEFDVAITDLRLGQTSGLDVLRLVKERQPTCEVVMITAFATAETAVEAMKLGAFDYLFKPFKTDELLVVLDRALEKRALVQENQSLRRRLRERHEYADMVGKSRAMQELFALIEKIAPTRVTVLVLGESGVGKELVARAIHQKSLRADGPFVVVNCGAIPEGLIESELFGHEKGAFTGASHSKRGLFDAAHGGTLFLDEVGELPLHVQVKLLRALQQRTIRSVGGVQDREVDVRIVAATNRDLEQEVREGRFREDLYYRLNVIGLRVPPLRERKEDILPLVEHFMERHGARPGMRLSREAQKLLLEYEFPGNVRELENLVERAITLADGDEIGPDVFPPEVRRVRPSFDESLLEDAPIPPGFDLQAWLDAFERRMLERALEQAGGVKVEAARLLGISFRSFRYRLAKYRMEEEKAAEAKDERATGS
ncbi:MAG: sigma-54 dependent transcriptional regulator [Pseudomonadota bacterium]|nr:MAG: Fis family transcriptional regulator [Pseudomonadota bacterium]